MTEGKNIRFMFMGRILENDLATLQELNIEEDCVLHALVSDAKPPSPPHPGAEESDGDTLVVNGLDGPDVYNNPAAMAAYREEDNLVREGTMGHFLLGFFLGLVFRELTLFWVCFANLPRKQKAGILCGVLLGVVQDVIWGERPLKSATGSSSGNAGGINGDNGGGNVSNPSYF